MAEPYDCDRTDFYFLETFQFNEDTLIYLINNTEHTTANKVHMVYWNSNSDASEIK